MFYKHSNQKDKYIYWNKKVIKTVNPFINLICDLTNDELSNEFKNINLGLSGIGGFLIALNTLGEFGLKLIRKTLTILNVLKTSQKFK